MTARDEFLRTPGRLPWRMKPTRPRNPVTAIIFDADNRLVAACAYGNAALIVEAVNSNSPTPNPQSPTPSSHTHSARAAGNASSAQAKGPTSTGQQNGGLA